MRTEETSSRPRVASREKLLERYEGVRRRTEDLCAPLAPEDCVLQSMPLASPTRWHLAHTTWFFETFLLARAEANHAPFHPAYEELFNSYYETIGKPLPQAERGMLSRPTVAEVFAYRRDVDLRVRRLLEGVAELADGVELDEAGIAAVVELGVQHEQQHQELILTDIQHALSLNPMQPVYREAQPRSSATLDAAPLHWESHAEEICTIGTDADGFAFDNEVPSHRRYLHPHRLATRLVTNREYAEFVEDGGYARHELWLSEGFATAQERGWQAPLYWERTESGWERFSLHGRGPLELDAPVCHVSYFEADAFARWAGARLPMEEEWENAARDHPVEGNFLESDALRPRPARGGERDEVTQLFGDVWEWTASAYAPYPGFRRVDGALGEYNGKFMCNQYVLRGGSCFTPRSHVRSTYRNFFPPDARWQMSGIRLTRDGA